LRVGQSLKKIAIKILIEVNNPYVIFLQELMTNRERVVHELSKILGSWEFSYIDAKGRLGGNITGWKKGSFSYTNSWDFSSGLGTSLFSLDLGKEITFLNIYGPYLDRVEY
jgi:hypothetical protein